MLPLIVIVPVADVPGVGTLVITTEVVNEIPEVVSVLGGTVVLMRPTSTTLANDAPLIVPLLETGERRSVEPFEAPKVAEDGVVVAL
jgi:hypothetical protein